MDSNEQAVKILQDAVTVSKIRKTPLPHILISGPAGTGKTTLSNICANEMGNCELITTIGSSFKTQEDIMEYIWKIFRLQKDKQRNAILFVDEIHDLGKKGVPETLWYPILEDFAFYHNLAGNIIDDDYFLEGNNLQLQPFTIVGATTDVALLKKPMRDRFPIVCTLKDYSEEDMQKVIKFNTDKRLYVVSPSAIRELANRSRGNPRVAINLTESAERKRIVLHKDKITKAIVVFLFKDLKIRRNGITENDIAIMKALKRHPKGAGINVLSGITSIDKKTITDIHLSYLAKLGYTITTHKQFLTEKGLSYLKGI
jgi:Holliday junction DNA helicase RuvB